MALFTIPPKFPMIMMISLPLFRATVFAAGCSPVFPMSSLLVPCPNHLKQESQKRSPHASSVPIDLRAYNPSSDVITSKKKLQQVGSMYPQRAAGAGRTEIHTTPKNHLNPSGAGRGRSIPNQTPPPLFSTGILDLLAPSALELGGGDNTISLSSPHIYKKRKSAPTHP